MITETFFGPCTYIIDIFADLSQAFLETEQNESTVHK